MEPHHELARKGIIDDLRTFKNAATFNVGTRFIAYGQCYALILPIVKIIRRITTDSHLSQIAGLPLRLVLAVPLILSAMEHDSASMRVYCHAISIFPQLSGPELRNLSGGTMVAIRRH